MLAADPLEVLTKIRVLAGGHGALECQIGVGQIFFPPPHAGGSGIGAIAKRDRWRLIFD